MESSLNTILSQVRNNSTNEPAWLTSLRKNAVDFVIEKGLPSTREEDWKYTPLDEMYRREFHLPISTNEGTRITLDQINDASLIKEQTNRIIFLNGKFLKDLSDLPIINRNIRVQDFRQLLRETPQSLRGLLFFERDSVFSSLNMATMQDGILVETLNSSREDKLIHIMNVSTEVENTLISPRMTIKSHENSKINVIEEFIDLSGKNLLVNAVTNIEIGQGATVEHHRISNCQSDSYHIGKVNCNVARDGNFTSTSIALGGNISRIDIDIALNEPGACCTLNGLFIGEAEELIDHHTTIDHISSNTTSCEQYKGVMGGQSKGIFNGKVIVRENISGVQASQNSDNILLSQIAEINTKPELQIYSDDVKCAHGATVGALDSDSIFYLRSRGLRENDAKNLLIEAFVEETLVKIPADSIKESIRTIIRNTE